MEYEDAMILLDDAPMRLLQAMSGQGGEADPCERSSSSCLIDKLLTERLRFKSWGSLAQARHALELAKRADVARGNKDADAALCALYLGVSWLQAPQRGTEQQALDDPCKSQRFVCSALCDALNTADLNHPRLQSIAAPALELLSTIKEAASVAECCAVLEIRQWCRMLSVLSLPGPATVQEPLQPPTPQKASPKEPCPQTPPKPNKPATAAPVEIKVEMKAEMEADTPTPRRQRLTQKGASDAPTLQCKPWLGSQMACKPPSPEIKNMGGWYRCPHGKIHRLCSRCPRYRTGCKHGKRIDNCIKCDACEHGRLRRLCPTCTGCPHGKRKDRCEVCNACPHGKRKDKCLECTSSKGSGASPKKHTFVAAAKLAKAKGKKMGGKVETKGGAKRLKPVKRMVKGTHIKKKSSFKR